MVAQNHSRIKKNKKRRICIHLQEALISLQKRKHTKTPKKNFKVSKESKGAKSTSHTNHLAIDVTNFHDFDD
jgi:hypothetical protein